MREIIENSIRSDVLRSGKGRLVEGSLKLFANGKRTHHVHYQISCVNGRKAWYGTLCNDDGDRIAKLFN